MPTTYQKRQKEMKRRDKQLKKAERRDQRKLAHRKQKESFTENTTPLGDEVAIEIGPVGSELLREN